MTRQCGSCGAAEMVSFCGESLTVDYRDRQATVENLSGFRCALCGEIEFEPESAVRYAEAGDALVFAARQAVGLELRRIRKKLNLKQAEAARLTGGGHNAFSRYETGAIEPSPAVINLFRLLERHPEELDRLKAG